MPGDIRPILEATYADPATAEPSAWRELREQLERRKVKMAQLALSATAIWNNPPLDDEEGVQTRFSSYPTAQLLLATQSTPVGVHSARLDLLNGDTVTVGDRARNFDARKAIHRNLVRVPRWAVATGLAKPPRWLAAYVSQPTALGLLQPGGDIHWPSDGGRTGISYQADQGIVIDRQRVPRAGQEESDESYD